MEKEKISDLYIIKEVRNNIYLCKCICGQQIERSRKYLLKKNRSKSCGCKKKREGFRHFETKFKKTEGCWEWKGKLTLNGYGKFRGQAASRASYEFYIGKIPQEICVCHTCDNRICVNPQHLFLGSISDNLKDMTNKGRRARGKDIGTSLLNENIVQEIRKDRLRGMMYRDLESKYAIGSRTIRGICKNQSWQHVPFGEECKKYVSPHDKNQRQHMTG